MKDVVWPAILGVIILCLIAMPLTVARMAIALLDQLGAALTRGIG